MSVNTGKNVKTLTRGVCTGLTILTIIAFLPLAAYASGGAGGANTPILQGLICSLAHTMLGTTGKALSAVALIALGIGALFGKLSWQISGTVAVGIALVFGATSIVNAVGGPTANACTNGSGFSFSCSGGTPSNNLFDTDNMTSFTSPNGATLITNDDPTNGPCTGVATADAVGNNGIFATIICFFKTTIGQILSAMYCQFKAAMFNPLTDAFAIFFVVFGIMMALGITNFTTKEAVMFVVKFGLIWTFAQDPAWSIGLGYQFFMTLADEGSKLVLANSGGLQGVQQLAGKTPLTAPDATITGLLSFVSQNSPTNWTNAQFAQTSGGMSSYCIGFLGALLFLLLMIMPVVATFLIMLLIQYLGFYFRAILGYLSSLLLITFLFVLAPLFVGFALFTITKPLFEQWLKYLISFSIQMIVVFAFLAVISMTGVTTFVQQMLGMIQEYNLTTGKWFYAMPMHACSICDYTITPGAPDSIACNTGLTSQAALAAGDVAAINVPNGGGQWVVPLSALMQHQDFIRFVTANAIAYYLIFWVLQDFMKRVPEFARALGGLPFVQGLTAGAQFPGLDMMEGGLQQYISKNPMLAQGVLGAGVLGGAGAAIAARSYGAGGGGSGNSGSGATVSRTSPAHLARTGIGSGIASSASDSGPATMPTDPSVKQAILDASDKVGVDAGYMMAMARQESSFKADAQAGTSSAKGLYQFTDGTWKAMVDKYGAQYGFGMNDRLDAKKNAIAGALFARDNAKKIGTNDASSLYMAHFLGAGGANKVLDAMQHDPNAKAADLMAGAAKANHNIFYKKDGTARTVTELYAVMKEKVGGRAEAYNIALGRDPTTGKVMTASAGGAGKSSGGVQVASSSKSGSGASSAPSSQSQGIKLASNDTGVASDAVNAHALISPAHAAAASSASSAPSPQVSQDVSAMTHGMQNAHTPAPTPAPTSASAPAPASSDVTQAFSGAADAVGGAFSGNIAMPSLFGSADASGTPSAPVTDSDTQGWGSNYTSQSQGYTQQKKAEEEAAAGNVYSSAAATTAAAPVADDTLKNLQQQMYNTVKALDMKIQASRGTLPEETIRQAESIIGAAWNELSTGNSEEGINRLMAQLQMMSTSLV